MVLENSGINCSSYIIDSSTVLETQKMCNTCTQGLSQDTRCDSFEAKQKVNTIQEIEYATSKDFLSRLPLNDTVLNVLLDIAMDNFETYNVNILEISHHSVMFKEIEKYLSLNTWGRLFPTFTILRTMNGASSVELINTDTNDAEINLLELEALSFPKNMDLLVSKDVFTNSVLNLDKHLKTLINAVKYSGFILLIERTALTPAEKVLNEVCFQQKIVIHTQSVLEEAFRNAGLVVIAKRKDRSTFVAYLLRKPAKVLKKPRLFMLNEKENNYAWVEELKTVMKENEDCQDKRKTWVFAESPESGVVGLLKTLRGELNGKYLRYFYNARFPGCSETLPLDVNNTSIQEQLSKDLRSNVYRNNQYGYFSNRKLPDELPRVPARDSYLNMTGRGGLSSLEWIESPNKFWNSSNKIHESQVKVQVFYTSLNFRDVMIASGKLHWNSKDNLSRQDCRMGLEFSGVEVKSGRRVMGVVPCRGLANTVVCSIDKLLDVPPEWTLEEASTIPIAYMTAYYALLIRGRLKEGESVLIHSGAGAVGQAAISISSGMNCRVFTTVGSEEKRQFLVSQFPDLDPQDIFNSRTLDFEKDVFHKTTGKGVDLVLNSMAEEMLRASVRCLKPHGRFLEIGMYDVIMDHPLGLSHFKRNTEFHGINVHDLIESEFIDRLSELTSAVMEGIKRGCVRPLKTKVFSREKAEEAFRFLSSGKNIGKVVLKVRDDEEPNAAELTAIADQEVLSIPRTYFDPAKSVVITGGLGGFGFELCHWLIDRGAKHLILSSRTGVKNSYQRMWIDKWTAGGVQLKVCNHNIMDPEGCRRLLLESSQMAPLGAIFHLAMVLHDGLFLNLTPEDFTKVCGPKVEGMKNLDFASRELCPDLDYFCAFSSMAANMCVPGTSNYAYANSAMERMIELRRADNLPGQAIQYGPIDDVGMVYEEYGDTFKTTDPAKGIARQSLASCLDVLDRALQENIPVVASMEICEQHCSSANQKKDLIPLLCKILGISNPDALSPDTTLGNLGLDSLMLVETKQILEAEYATSLSIPEIFKLTVQRLQDISEKANEEL